MHMYTYTSYQRKLALSIIPQTTNCLFLCWCILFSSTYQFMRLKGRFKFPCATSFVTCTNYTYMQVLWASLQVVTGTWLQKPHCKVWMCFSFCYFKPLTDKLLLFHFFRVCGRGFEKRLPHIEVPRGAGCVQCRLVFFFELSWLLTKPLQVAAPM